MNQAVGLFEENKESIKKQIEDRTGDKVIDLSFAYYESRPDNWHIYDTKGISRMLFEEGDKYFLVYYKSKRTEGWLCSTTYAIVDSRTLSVVDTFEANDEG